MNSVFPPSRGEQVFTVEVSKSLQLGARPETGNWISTGMMWVGRFPTKYRFPHRITVAYGRYLAISSSASRSSHVLPQPPSSAWTSLRGAWRQRPCEIRTGSTMFHPPVAGQKIHPSLVLKCSEASNPLWAFKKCLFLRWWTPLYIQDSILPKHLHPQHRGRHRFRQWTHHKAALLWQLGLERQWPLVCLRVLSNVHSPFFCVETLWDQQDLRSDLLNFFLPVIGFIDQRCRVQSACSFRPFPSFSRTPNQLHGPSRQAAMAAHPQLWKGCNCVKPLDTTADSKSLFTVGH